MKNWKRIISFVLVATMVMQLSHLENYRYVREVLAAPVETKDRETMTAEEDEEYSSESTESENIEKTDTEKDSTEEITQEETIEPKAVTSAGEQSDIYDYETMLSWQELEVEDGVIEEDFNSTAAYKLVSDLTIKGNMNIYAPINLNGYSLTVEGDVSQYQMTVLNGDMAVYGNYDWQAGDTVFDEGYIYIAGNFSVCSECSNQIFMKNHNDYMLVNGNIILDAESAISTDIVAGTIDLKGDFVQKVAWTNYTKQYSEGDFLMEGDSVLLLSGENSQNIFVSKETSGFQRVEVSIEGLDKNDKDEYIFGEHQIGFSGLCNYEEYVDNGCPTTYGYMVYKELPEDSEYIYGSCYYTGEPLYAENRMLTVIGDFIQNAGLQLKNTYLYVTDDYRIQSIDENGEYSETEGYIDTTEGGNIYVYGDFYTQSIVDHTALLKKGTWNISGNLYQLGENAKNFTLSDSSNNIKMGDYTTSGEVHIYMENPLENQIHWLRANSSIKMYFDNGCCSYYGYAYNYFGFMYYTQGTGTYYGDVVIPSSTTEISSLYVAGSVTIQSDLKLTGYIDATGDVTVKGGAINVTSGGIYANNINFVDKSDSSLALNGANTRIDCEDFYYGSSNALVMEGDNCGIYCNDFYYASDSVSGNLTNGMIVFKGDFYVKDVGVSDSFVCSGNHRLYAEGSDGFQHITIENPASCIETLDVSNGTNGLTISTEGTNIHNINNYSYSYVWEGIEGYTLEQDMVYNEDLVIYAGTLDLNGHTLTVNGDFVAARGTININGGHLVVNGDMKLAYRDWSTGEPQYYKSTVDIVMAQEQDKIDIVGDWYINFQNHSLENMTDGIVTLSGNMNIDGSVTSSSYTSLTETVLSGTSLHLTGTETQTITGVSKQIYVKPGDLVIENVNEVSVELPVYVSGELQLPKQLQYGFYSITLADLGNLTNRIFKGNITVNQSNLASDTKIEGTLYIQGITDLCGYTITADKISVRKPVTLSKGKLKTGTLYMYDKIYMQQSQDTIETDYMYVDVTTTDSDYMTDGNIYIKERFSDSTSSSYAFLPSGDNTITFTKEDASSDNPVIIRFTNSTSILNRVVLSNLLNCYSLNREKEEIAKELIMGYEDIEKPSCPENVTSTAAGSIYINLSWNEATDDQEVYRYKVYRNGEYVTRIKGTTYTDAVLKPNTTYRYTISVIDAAGNESEQSPVLEVTTAKDIMLPYYSQSPEIKVSKDKVTIDCDQSFADEDGYVDYYIITKDGEEVGRVSENSKVTYKDVNGTSKTKTIKEGNPVYEEAGLEYGVEHAYGVVAVDSVGNVSEEFTEVVIANLSPGVPENFSLTSESGFNIISFARNGEADISYYKIYRDGSQLTQINNTAEDVYNYIDKEVEVGETHTYYVKAYNRYNTSGEETHALEITTIEEVTPPTITAIAYSNNTDYVNGEMDICITAADESALDSVYAYIVKSGEETKKEIYRKEVEDYGKTVYAYFTLNVEGLDGEYELHTVVVDHCGNEKEAVKICKVNMGGLPRVEITNTATSASVIYMEWAEIEGAAYYIIEQKYDESYTKRYKVFEPQAHITGLYCDTEYTYRVVAYDEDNVRGLAMEGIQITTSSDVTSPEFRNLYSDDTVLGTDETLLVKYEDDVLVAKVYAYYRKEGESTWNIIKEKLINDRSGTAYVPWDKTGLASGDYEVRYVLEDTSGNRSEEEIRTYHLDLVGPAIQNFQLTPKDWAIELSWDAVADSDYESYEIKRILLSEYENAIKQNADPFEGVSIIDSGIDACIFEELISPDYEYVYQLSVYDVNKNVSIAIAQGTPIDNDIISPEVGAIQPMFAAQDISMLLSAQNCSDNDGIATYQWDMGNGDVVYGENCEYIYTEPGTYEMILTVTDYNGNTSATSTSVTVGSDIGTVKVTVSSGGKGVPEAEVLAHINGQACKSGTDSQTDSQGKLTIALPAGTYKIASYADQYLPNEEEVTVVPGKTTEVTIELELGEMIESEFTTKEMTQKEMEEAGIVPSANTQCFQYTMDLKFQQGKMETITFNSTQKSVRYSTSFPNAGDETNLTINNISDDPSQPLFIITQTTQVSISWLQNIYQVNCTISNQADEQFYLEDAKAEISLEGGLILAKVEKGNVNSQKWEIGTLPGGESKSHAWYVTANESNRYPLEVELNATMQPFNKKITKTLVSENELKIQVGTGLHLYIYPEKDAYIGEQYYVQFKLVNESSETYHNVTTSFGAYETVAAVAKVINIVNCDGVETSQTISADTGAYYYVKDEDLSEARVTLDVNDKVTTKTLKAGQALYGTCRFQFNAAGDINRDYYKLVSQYGEKLDASNANVRVTIEPIASHLVKKVVELRFPFKNSQNRKTSLGDTTEKSSSSPTSNEKSAADWEAEQPNSTEEVKDPINLMTGAFTVDHVVAAVAGANTMSFDVSYNSLYTYTSGALGKGWYHNYEKRIERNGSLVTLYQNPYEVVYFAEDDKTMNVVSGTMDNDTIVLEDIDSVERTYYQIGSASKQCYIVSNQNGYILYTGSEQYSFDQSGLLNGYINEDGQKVSISQTKDSLTIVDCVTGKKIVAGYDEAGKVTSVKDAAGEVTTFQYEDDCMTMITSKSGTKLIYEYDEAGHILVGKEGDGTIYVENTFDEEGRVLTQISNEKEDEIARFSYQEDSEAETTTVTMTNANGTTEQAVSDKYGQGIRYVDAIGGVKEYTYNEYHNMTTYRYSDGTGADYSYDSNGNISKVVETTGKTTDYTYDDGNRVTGIVCNDGTNITYQYNEAGQLQALTSGNGLTVEYTYNEAGQVLTETSSLGTIEYTYEKGMLRCLKDYSGNYHYFTYDDNGNVIQYIDGAGVVTDYKIDVSGRVEEESVTMEDGTKVSTKYTYDGYGNVTSKTDAKGNTIQYIYNAEDLLEKEIRPDGTSYTYSYDRNGNLTKVVCPDGETMAESVYDAAGNTLSLTDTLKNVQKAGYSVGGQLLNLTQANGGKVSFTYYENGLLESQTDANGNQTTFVYDTAGRISKVTDGSGAATTFEYDKVGNLFSIENALGNSVTMEYNQYRKIVSQKDANDNVTQYAYDKAMNCTKVIDAEGGITEFVYDARGQITSMTKKGETEEQDVTLSMTYDNLGNVITLTDGEGNTQRMEYDANSQLVAVYDAYGIKTESYEYDCLGNCIRIKDAFGNVTTNSYDAMGNLVKQLNESTGNAVTYSYVGGKYLASSTDELGKTASSTYDSMGNVETLTNPNGGVTTYKYDLNNNLTDEIIGEDYHVRYTYNAHNLVATKTNSRDQQTVYSYDALGRIVKQEDEAGIIEYTYDANDNVLTVMETIGDQVNTITRTYDSLNRVKTYEDTKGNRIEYSYDKVGNLTRLTYPNGKAVAYTYNKNCSINSITDWSGRTTTYSYDKNGRLIKTIRPNGTVETREYDKAGQLTLILDMNGDRVVNRQEYSYDASGNITSVKQLYNGEMDFTEVTTAEMTYDENNRLLTYNGEEVEYDKDGNMTYGPLDGKMEPFEFDCRNRLVKAGNTTYEYDAENNRIAVTTGAKRTEYVVNSQPELSQVLQSKTIESGNDGAAELTYYYYGQGLFAQENSKGYLTYHFNNVGSTMAVTDANGDAVAKYGYSPYGELLEGEYDENIQFLYNGQYGVTTDGNGLYYMRARYYNVDIKRFVNQDVLTGTLERVSSLNRYSYVEGNPISYLDPFGLAIYIVQQLVDLASAIIAGLALLTFIAPQVALVLGIVLSVITIALDIVQNERYNNKFSDEKLKQDIVKTIIGLVVPIADEIGYLAEMLMFTWDYRNGVQEKYE